MERTTTISKTTLHICAWCQRSLGIRTWFWREMGLQNGTESHGICASCNARQLKMGAEQGILRPRSTWEIVRLRLVYWWQWWTAK